TTRAEQRLFLTRANFRTMHGKDYPSPPSRFLHEMQLFAGRLISPKAAAEADEQSPAATDDDRTTAADSAASTTGDQFRVDAAGAAGDESASERSPAGHAKRRRPTGMPFLTTGADLLNGTANPVDFPLTFAVGMSVRHPQLGLGQVIEAQGTGKWRTV